LRSQREEFAEISRCSVYRSRGALQRGIKLRVIKEKFHHSTL
jgi:hypothetical protein